MYYMHDRFLWAVKESGQKETRGLELRSLINCNYSVICSQTRYRSDNARFDFAE